MILYCTDFVFFYVMIVEVNVSLHVLLLDRKMKCTSTWCWTLSQRRCTGLPGILTRPRASFLSYMWRYFFFSPWSFASASPTLTYVNLLFDHVGIISHYSSSGVHVPAVSQPGLHPFPGCVSQRHQAPKPAGGPWDCHPQAVWLWQVSLMSTQWSKMEEEKYFLFSLEARSRFAPICLSPRSILQCQAAGPWRAQRVVYLLAVLSRPWAHFWCHRLHGKHWHLVSGLRSGWAAAGTANIPRRQWGGSAGRDYQGESLHLQLVLQTSLRDQYSPLRGVLSAGVVCCLLFLSCVVFFVFFI